jgi:hypothetical protein
MFTDKVQGGGRRRKNRHGGGVYDQGDEKLV